MRSIFIAPALLAAAAAAGTAIADTETTDTWNPDLSIKGLGEFFFEFDSARAPADTSEEIAKIAVYAKSHPDERIVLDGFADTTGNAAYNVGLSIRRGKSIESKLVAAGVDPDKIVVVAYGEDGMRRTTDAFDRRVTVWASGDPLYTIIDHSLAVATSVVWEKGVSAAELEAPRPDTGVASR